MNTKGRQKEEYQRLLGCLKGLDANRRKAYDRLLNTYSKVMTQISKGLPEEDQGPFSNLWQ